ncbi:MAG: hypothetical protein M3Q33_13740 [Acidobacteriota bacterium]|nr:hypothetical protein [Acidobacteriota bacterium]
MGNNTFNNTFNKEASVAQGDKAMAIQHIYAGKAEEFNEKLDEMFEKLNETQTKEIENLTNELFKLIDERLVKTKNFLKNKLKKLRKQS